MEKIDFSCVDITGGFWKKKQDMAKSVTVKAVYDRFSETHRFDAFSCVASEDYIPHVFWDSDVAKWIEGAAYIMEKDGKGELYELCESVIDNIIKNQDEHGYFNSHFLVIDKDKCFSDRSCHELYCAGHLIEAAVAYFHATGKRRFLDAMCKYADYIERVFKIEKSAAFRTPGHPELELALVKLYEATGEKRYLELSKYFIDIHGTCGAEDSENDSVYNWSNSLYNMDDMPLSERDTIDGHAVRAFYLYSGAADIARLYADKELADACKRVFDNAVNKRMYITGGFGSTHLGEAFTVDYDLPSRTAYAETCAAISMAFFASRMQLLEVNSKYADTVERVIYNGILSGVSMEGNAFFYENPLEVDPDFNDVNKSTNAKEYMPITQRVEVFDCSCCPPNIVRFIPSIADYMYSFDEETLYVHQYMSSSAKCGGMEIEQTTDYPENGKIRIRCTTCGRKIALRIPGWCRSFKVNHEYEMKNGYAVMSTEGEILLELDMPVTALRANRRVHACAGRVAVMRGPVVYCAEGTDNERDIKNMRIKPDGEFRLSESEFMLPAVKTKAWVPAESDNLYDFASEPLLETELTLIPYYAFANRGETEMQVWLLEK